MNIGVIIATVLIFIYFLQCFTKGTSISKSDQFAAGPFKERKDLKDRRLRVDPKKTYYIKQLVAQTSRWTAASQQDISPAIALMHANYGAAYMMALQDIATHTEIYNASGVDMLHLRDKVLKTQDKAMKKVAYACPQYKGDIDPYLISVGSMR